MGLSKREFTVLMVLRDGKAASQRDVATCANVSLGTVNSIMKKLHTEGLAEGVCPYRSRHADVGTIQS